MVKEKLKKNNNKKLKDTKKQVILGAWAVKEPSQPNSLIWFL
jgi:hypothetical protein